MKTLSLVIPVYNEQATLKQIVDNVLKIQTEEIKLEIIIVDDCSSDNSYDTALRIAQENPCVRVFRQDKNQGKGAALRKGFSFATGDYIGIQDADMEYNPKDYLKMIKPLIENKADVVYGSRYLKQDTRRVLYFWHTFMNKALTLLTNMYTNLDITDMETCYKLFKKEVINSIIPKLKENRFGFEPEITVYISKGKFRVYECAITYNPRTYEEGKKICAKDGLRALYCILHYGAHSAPIPMQFILYILIGGISAIANILIFLILMNLNISLVYSIGIAFIFSAVINYLLCIVFLFRHKAHWTSFGEILSYILTVAIMGSLDYGITYGLLFFGMSNFWAKALSSLIGVVGNFLLRKYFVFLETNKNNIF